MYSFSLKEITNDKQTLKVVEQPLGPRLYFQSIAYSQSMGIVRPGSALPHWRQSVEIIYSPDPIPGELSCWFVDLK
jgi:hypothetical protein